MQVLQSEFVKEMSDEQGLLFENPFSYVLHIYTFQTCLHCSHLIYTCNQGQQADHVAKGVARQHELQDHHDCSHLRLTERFLRNPLHDPDCLTRPPHEKEEN